MSEFDWPNHFSWIFSTFAQSLAAIIGIIGVLAVFRLQIQHSIVRESFERLREVLLNNDPRGNQLAVSSMTFEQILNHAMELNNFLVEVKSGFQKKVDQAKDYIQRSKDNPGVTLIFHHQEVDDNNKKIIEIDKTMGRLTLLTRECKQGHKDQRLIGIEAYILTRDLGVNLIFSLLALLVVKQLSKNPCLGNIVACLITILLLCIGFRGLKFFNLCLKSSFMNDVSENIYK